MNELCDLDFPFTFCWEIQNFSLGRFCTNEWLSSPPFKVPYTNSSWVISLCKNASADKYVSIYLRRISKEQMRENKDYVIVLSIVDVDGSDAKYIDYEERSIENFDYWGAKKFISWNSLLEEREILLPKDTLTIQCVMRSVIFQADCFLSFRKDFEKLYDKEKRYPLQIKLINKNTEGEVQSGKYIDKSKYYKNPILHSWLDYLYSDRLNSWSFCSLEAAMEKVIIEDKRNEQWQNGLPKQWLSRSYLQTENVFFTWHIKEFSHLNLNDKFFSPAFHCGSHDWKLLFYLSADDDEIEKANIFICPMSLYLNSKKIVKCKICVVNKDGRFPLSQESVHRYDNDGQWKFPSFIQVDVLKSNKKLYLSNDILCLYCTFSVSEDEYTRDQSWTVVEHYSKALHTQYISFCSLLQMRADTLALFECGRYSDIKVKIGQYELSAHKSVLSQRSSEFKYKIKNFNKNKKALDEMAIEITDISEEALKDLLAYIYSGNHSFIFERNFRFLALKYGVDEEIVSKEIIVDFPLFLFGGEERWYTGAHSNNLVDQQKQVEEHLRDKAWVISEIPKDFDYGFELFSGISCLWPSGDTEE